MRCKMAEVEWTPESTIRLIGEFRRRAELWDSTHEMYRVQTAKYEAWSELAKIFECDIADLRKKLNSVFASHRREKAKVRGGGRSTWFLYNHLDFLPTHVGNPPDTEKQTLEQEVYELEQSSDDEDDGQELDVIIKQEPNTNLRETIASKKGRSKANKLQRVTRPLLKRRLIKDKDTTGNLDSKLLETLRLLRKSDLSRKKDECDTFGEYIAVSLRKHDERTQSMIKQAINNILFEQEMKKYSSGYTLVISGSDENPLVLSDDK